VALEARSEVREAYAAYRSAYDTAQVHSRELLPLRQKISDEMLLRYNGMLIGVNELLDDARSRAMAAGQALAAQRASGWPMPGCRPPWRRARPRDRCRRPGRLPPQRRPGQRGRGPLKACHDRTQRFLPHGGRHLLGAAAVSRAGAALLPEAATQTSPETQVPPRRPMAGPSSPWSRSTAGPCPGA
jgi:hypothetical protein